MVTNFLGHPVCWSRRLNSLHGELVIFIFGFFCDEFTVQFCPNSITSILLKTCLKPGFRQVLSRKKVGNLVSDKFWAEKSRKPGFRQDRSISTCRDRSSGKFSTNKKVRDLVTDKFWAEKKSETWSPTCLRPGLRQVVRQDRSNGIWAFVHPVINSIVTRPSETNALPLCQTTTTVDWLSKA